MGCCQLAAVPLLADAGASDGKVALLMGVATVLGGAVTWAFNALAGWQSRRRAERKEDERTIVDHLQALVDRLRVDIEGLQGEVDGVGQKLMVAELRVERVLGHVRYLESVLRTKKIPFDPIDSVPPPGGGSWHEIPVPPGGIPQPPGGKGAKPNE